MNHNFRAKTQIFLLRAWSRLSPQNQEVVVRTILSHCLVLARRDTLDHMLVRFLPLVNDVFASMPDLQRLVSIAQLVDTSPKNTAGVTSTKVPKPYPAPFCLRDL